MKPNRKYDVAWDEDFKVLTPEGEYLNDLINHNIEIFPEDQEDTLRREAEEYFANYAQSEVSKKAALLIYDKRNNSLVGSIMTYISNESPVLEAIAVKQEYRGRGIATKLINHASNVYFENGYHAVKLTVFKDNVKAISLYKKLGFAQGLPVSKLVYVW